MTVAADVVGWLREDRALTVADMADLPEDEFRCELDDGMLVVFPTAGLRHQLAVAGTAPPVLALVPHGRGLARIGLQTCQIRTATGRPLAASLSHPGSTASVTS